MTFAPLALLPRPLPILLPNLDPQLAQQLRARWDAKTKPLGSLGALEALAVHIGQVQNALEPKLERPQLLVFAGDHGAVNIDGQPSGISAYPSDVTWQMVMNFLSGGAAVAVLARQFGCALTVVDAGVHHRFEPQAVATTQATTLASNQAATLLDRKVGWGTRSYLEGPAMMLSECEVAFAAGRRIGAEAEADVLLLGEMGIGNSASAALLMHHFAGVPLVDCVGSGTGLDTAGIAKKAAVLQRAVLRHQARLRDATPMHALAAYGGFEIAMLAGCMVGAASARKVVVVDGFIVSAAALAAEALQPGLCRHLVFAHCSAEHAHRRLLAHLQVTPLLDLGLRLGEGSGSALALPLIRAALALLAQMATFDSAGVATATP